VFIYKFALALVKTNWNSFSSAWCIMPTVSKSEAL